MFIKKETYQDKLELIELYKHKNNCNVDRINDYKNQIYDLKARINYFEKQQSNLYKQNQELTDWVIKILKEFGTCDTREQHVQIPIMREIGHRAYNRDFNFINKEERITIPSITLIKLGGGSD